MDGAQAYKLKVYDEELARFEFAKTSTGFRARGLEVDESRADLLPLNIRSAPGDVELARFLESRRIPKGRAYLEEVLRPYGLAPTDTKGVIDLSRGASVNDAFSVVLADDDIPYAEYNLFDNEFDEVLQIIAYTGVVPEGVIGRGRPSDLTPSGTFPKTWRKVGGKLVLFKAGSAVAAPNYGKEPYSELFASQVASLTSDKSKLAQIIPANFRHCARVNTLGVPPPIYIVRNETPEYFRASRSTAHSHADTSASSFLTL